MQHTIKIRKRTRSVLILDHSDVVLLKKYQYKIGNMKKKLSLVLMFSNDHVKYISYMIKIPFALSATTALHIAMLHFCLR